MNRTWLSVFALVGLSIACAPTAPPATPAPPVARDDLDLDEAAKSLADDLSRQAGSVSTSRTAVFDTFVDKNTGQQNETTQRLESALSEALPTGLRTMSVEPFSSAAAQKAEWVVSGSLVEGEENRHTANVAITDRASGVVVAQSAARFIDDGAGAPSRFYNDSPSVGKDRVVDGLVKTSETTAGKSADALYLEQLPTAAILKEALDAYNGQQWQDALNFYTAAAARRDGQQIRTFNGLYLSNIRLGRAAAAEEAFGRIVTLGLATNNLAVKILFQTGSTRFTPGPDLGAVYPMWIRQVARGAVASRSCLNVVGHTSRSGSEAVNLKLSRDRADTVIRMLESESAGLRGRMAASGVGFRENIVGTGADDASDAVDRRVEFKVVPCPPR